MKRIEIINREVRDVTYEVVLEDHIVNEIETLSQAERLEFFKKTEDIWQLIDWGLKRVDTQQGLNIQQVEIDKGRKVTQRYEEIYSSKRHDIEADPELKHCQ